MPIGDDDFWWQSSGSSGSGSSGASPPPPPGAGASTPTGAAPTSAQQASDWAAGPQPSGAAPKPTDYNGSIVGNAQSYEDRHGQITYGWGSGTDPKLDCSHYTANVIGESDPNFDPKKDYQTTGQLKEYLGSSPPADGMYEKVDAKDVKPGDLVLFGGNSGHVGVVTEPIDADTGKGKYIGSQSSTGVAETNFGPKSGYWGKAGGDETITGYVRYKGKPGSNAGSTTKGSGAGGGAGQGKGKSDKGSGSAAKPTAKKVTNNDKEVAHKKSQHKATTKAPTDVHKPVGNGSPAPFMNWQWTSLLSAGSIMTFAEKAMIWLKSTGLVGPTETTHPSHNPGVKSGTYKAPAKAVTASKDLKVEGQKVVRETDKTKQNQGNTKGEVVKPPPPKAKAGKGKKKAKPAKSELMKPLKGKLTVEQLAAVAPNTPRATLEKALPGLQAAMDANGINTNGRAAAFLAQTAHESGGFTTLSENLNYSAKGLQGTWPKRFDAETAQEYARQPERIADKVYANRMGNGDEASGDGWTYRGGGYIQTTGKDNYTQFGASQGMDAKAAVAYTRTPDGAASSAGYYWSKNNLNSYADSGDLSGMTQVINGGQTGQDDRQKRYDAVLGVL